MSIHSVVARHVILPGAAVSLLLSLGLLSTATLAAEPRPNVVIIITDDMGYADIGTFGARDIKTPSIDSLARDGVKLTDFYANAPVCSPTRAGLMTGRYQQRYGIEAPLQQVSTAWQQGLRATGRSLPQLLKNSGYATALLGKWHIGYQADMSPNAHGFDYFFGFRAGYIDYYQHTDGDGQPDLWENSTPVGEEGYMTDLISDRSVRFIEQHARQPFFLEVAYNAPHWPYQRPDAPSTAIDKARHLRPDEVPTSTRADYVTMVERLDRGVGKILRALDDHSLARNTIVIFTNDNGGEWLSNAGPLFNRKSSVWEGGIRVPALIRWPATLPAGKTSLQVGITMDLTASVLAATSSAVPADTRLDGMNIFPILQGISPVVERTLFWRSSLGRTQKAVRSGDWKLVVDGANTMLFDVSKDIGERTDLTNQRLDVVAQMRPLLAAWESDVDAEAKANGTAAIHGRGPGGVTVPAAVPVPAAQPAGSAPGGVRAP
jgi:arylsulfatase A